MDASKIPYEWRKGFDDKRAGQLRKVPEESIIAYYELLESGKAKNKRNLIYRIIRASGPKGINCNQIAAIMNDESGRISPRITELKQALAIEWRKDRCPIYRTLTSFYRATTGDNEEE